MSQFKLARGFVGRYHVFIEHCLITSPQGMVGLAPVVVLSPRYSESTHANYIEYY